MIRHNIASRLVKAQIEKQISSLKQRQIEELERVRHIPPSTYWDIAIKRAEEVYSNVQIVKTPEGYKLWYGDYKLEGEIDGTGPFDTLREARHWFLNGGR